MDLSPFKLDIDELIKEFAEKELRTMADMKKVWLRRKFSYIFEAQLPTNLALFMQTLYSHSLSHMSSNKSLSHRLGSFYCLYCLYETQPFKPPYKIYLPLGGLKGLRALVAVAKETGISVVSAIVKKLLENNAFLFGSIDMNDYSEKDRVKELVNVQNACIQKMQEKLLSSRDIERYLYMDLGMELDLKLLTKITEEYAASKSTAIKEATHIVDIENIRHIAENSPTIGNKVSSINEEWGNQMEMLSQLTVPEQPPDPLMLLPATEPDLGSDDDQQPLSFMKLLCGDSQKPSNSVLQDMQVDDMDEDDDYDYIENLEKQLLNDL